MSIFLSPIDPVGSLLGLGLLMLGIGLLYTAWRRPQRHWPLIGAGWFSIALAYWPWMNAAGFDKGAALASLLPGVLALLLIIIRTDWRAQPKTPRPRATQTTPRTPERSPALAVPWQEALSLTQQILVVGVLSLGASLGVGLAVYALLDASVVNRTITAALVILLLWPGFMVWSHSRTSLLKPTLWFLALSLGGWLLTPALF